MSIHEKCTQCLDNSTPEQVFKSLVRIDSDKNYYVPLKLNLCDPDDSPVDCISDFTWAQLLKSLLVINDCNQCSIKVAIDSDSIDLICNECDKRWYGFKFLKSATSPIVERIAEDMGLHRTLPIQSRMLGCLLNDNGTINYYLDPNDWTKKIDGTVSDLTGTDGQVMIEVPTFYYQITENGDEWIFKFCLSQRIGFNKIDKFYVGAFKATVQRSTSKLASVCNYTTDYRGGNNNAAWDGADNTLIGKAVSNTSLTNFRTEARNRYAGYNWNCTPFWQRQWIWWLFVCEYATRYSQDAFNATLTIEGYHQGGLGIGVSALVKDDWDTFNSYYSTIPIGLTVSYGNQSGEVTYSIPGFPGVSGNNIKLNRYRGIEMPFGDIWDIVDGVNIYIQSDVEGGESRFYLCTDPEYFATGTLTNYDLITLLPRLEYSLVDIKELYIGDYGYAIPIETGGTYLQYYTDSYQTDIPDVGEWRVLLIGSYGHLNGWVGLMSFNCVYLNPTQAQIGTRLYYLL